MRKNIAIIWSPMSERVGTIEVEYQLIQAYLNRYDYVFIYNIAYARYASYYICLYILKQIIYSHESN